MPVDETKLRILWKNRDLTAAQIGERLGLTGVNVGARVRTLVARLGLPKRTAGHEGSRKPRKKAAGSRTVRQAVQKPYTPPLFTDPNAKPTKGPTGIARNEEVTTCQWPMGDPQSANFRFCGEPRVVGKPYCKTHTQNAYRPEHPRRGYDAT